MVNGFDFGQNIVQVIEALDLRRQRLGMIAQRAGADDAQAVFVQFRRIKLNFIGNDYYLTFFADQRVQPQVAHAAGDDQADVAVLDVVGGDRLADVILERFLIERHRQSYGMGGGEQTVNMRIVFKNLAVIYADALEDAVAIEQTMIKNGDLGVRFIHQTIIHPDFQTHTAFL